MTSLKEGKRERKCCQFLNEITIYLSKIMKKTFWEIATCTLQQTLYLALEKATSDSVLSMALLKPKIDFVPEVVSMREISSDFTSIDYIILMSYSVEEFFQTLKLIFQLIALNKFNERTEWKHSLVPVQKRNNYCFKVAWNKNYKIKYEITWNKTIKFVKGESVYMNRKCQKIFGLTSINPNISALKYGRYMEQHSSNSFF